MTRQEFCVPDESELMGFFGREPVERAVEDGYWCYEVPGPGATSLRFSFHVYERSVQTAIRAGAAPVATVSQEMATLLRVDGSNLRCDFDSVDSQTTLVVHGGEDYSVVWSTLRTA